jgi:hypothetical protein
MRPGRLLAKLWAPREHRTGLLRSDSPFCAVCRSALSAGTPCGCMDGHLATCPSRRPYPCGPDPLPRVGLSLVTTVQTCVRLLTMDSLLEASRPSRSPVIPVTSRFTALITSRSHEDVAFPPCTVRGRDRTDRRMNQLSPRRILAPPIPRHTSVGFERTDRTTSPKVEHSRRSRGWV